MCCWVRSPAPDRSFYQRLYPRAPVPGHHRIRFDNLDDNDLQRAIVGL